MIGVIASMAVGPKRVRSRRLAQVCIGGSDVIGGAVSTFDRSPSAWRAVTTPTSRDEKWSVSWASARTSP